ncbi:MAG: alpha/beta hydrolase [Prevotella sp.]|nr:alpha/beta hydrolase [Prevotella sp.]
MKKVIYFFLILMLTASIQVGAQSLDGTWKGVLSVGPQKLTLILHVSETERSAKLDVMEQGAKGLPLAVNVMENDSLNVAMTQIGLHYAGRLRNGVIEGTFSQNGFTTQLIFNKGEVVLKRPQEPKPPFPYRVEEVKFDHKEANVTLAGTLTFPEGYKEGQKVPVVLMVTGSGPQNRDEELMGHKPFLVLADRLARHGIASLRYDDRGTGLSTGDFSSVTTAALATDALAGIKYLRGLKKFSCVGILGHSEGGSIAYMLGAGGNADFIVSLAGPACKVDTLMMLQLNKLSRLQGAKGDVAHNVAETRQLLLSQDGGPWMKAFLNMDFSQFLKSVKCPVMALGGSNDLNVPAEFNMKVLKSKLPSNSKDFIKIYPGLNHLFQHSSTGNPLDYVNIEETMSEEVMNDVCTWINKVTNTHH